MTDDDDDDSDDPELTPLADTDLEVCAVCGSDPDSCRCHEAIFGFPGGCPGD